MQIIPRENVFDGAGLFGSFDNRGGENFMSAMEDALGSVSDGDNVSVSSALADEKNGPLVDSPYTRHTTDGITYTLSEVCFSKNELLELRRQLLKEGAPEASLRQFDILADQPDGATLAQVMASLMGGKTQYQLTEQDEHRITALLGQIDPSGNLAATALDFMRGGDNADALELIRGALGKMGSDDAIDLDPEGIIALGKGLGLNAGAINGLLANFGGRDSLTLNGAQFDKFLNPAKNQILEDAAAAKKLADALDKTLGPIISKARDRMEKEKAAAALEDRRVAQSRVLIDRTVQENSRKTLDDTATGANKPEKAGELANQLKSDALRKALQDAEIDPKAEFDAKTDHRGSILENLAHKFANTKEDSGKGELFDKKGDSGWNQLLGKIETKAQPGAAAASTVAYSMVAGSRENDAASALQQPIPNLPAHLAGQVERGLLMATRDGATRLDLQLHPAELGALTITLVARNGELTAQIRSERTETAEMVARQLDTIKVSLEQQGIKVDKLEVQLQDNGDSNFQDAFLNLGDHNARRENDARRQEMARLRNMAALRADGENFSDSDLARSSQHNGRAARYAGNALHVVA